MVLDYEWKSYFTANASIPFGTGTAWRRPFELAYLNIANFPPDTQPKIKQYVAGQRYQDGLRVQGLKYIEITKTLMFGSTAQIIYAPISDRDLFEIVPNEGTGQMFPRMKFPYRMHELNLQSKTDSSMPSPAMFRGHLVNASVQCISDIITTDDDGSWRIQLDFRSYEHPDGQLGRDIGAPLWYHRANNTQNLYHYRFANTDNITFDEMITQIVAWMNQGRPTTDFPVTFSYTPKAALPYTYNLQTIVDIAQIPTEGKSSWQILKDVLVYMGAYEGLGKKYIPICSIAGVIDVTQGGYDKTAAVDEDFRSTQGMQKNTSTNMTIRFNLISVPFSATNDNEYWIKFTLYKWNGSGWDTVLNVPISGYEYVPYDVNNTHSRKYYKIPTQEISPEDTYKWDADLVTAGSFTIAGTGGSAFSPQTYQFINSPLTIDHNKVNTFLVTVGGCQNGYGFYDNVNNITGCKDGGLLAGSGYQKCIEGNVTNYDQSARRACYPDPLATPTESVNVTYGIKGKNVSIFTISNLNNFDTRCRLNSKKLYECHLNTGSLIRDPIKGKIIFNEGYTGDLIGKYIEVYSPEIDDMVILRVTEQKHVFTGNRLTTVMDGFRV